MLLALCEKLGPILRKPVRSTDLFVEKKILTALSFYGTGSYQRPVGDISAHSMAQQTVSSRKEIKHELDFTKSLTYLVFWSALIAHKLHL
ncbi:unnamed protein product [Arctia plantaginis]|uniref:Uncharacterized protein n=1 Tax=Arctia plantaginis TaxID=874455 RepID=A0A8S1ABV7_ARCPL|nr:unnamed protein product [Arctia plantaginis]